MDFFSSACFPILTCFFWNEICVFSSTKYPKSTLLIWLFNVLWSSVCIFLILSFFWMRLNEWKVYLLVCFSFLLYFFSFGFSVPIWCLIFIWSCVANFLPLKLQVFFIYASTLSEPCFIGQLMCLLRVLFRYPSLFIAFDYLFRYAIMQLYHCIYPTNKPKIRNSGVDRKYINTWSGIHLARRNPPPVLTSAAHFMETPPENNPNGWNFRVYNNPTSTPASIPASTPLNKPIEPNHAPPVCAK